jgi:alpha-1,6-mannosyltransferase
MSVHGPLGAADPGAVQIRARTIGTRRLALRERAGAVGIAGLLVTTLLVALGGANTDQLLPESVRPVPHWLAGPFGSTGLDLGKGGLILVLIVMFGSYVIAAQAAERLPARTVLMCIAAMHALVLLAPPLLSTDVFSYQFYGRMGAVYGANAYLAGPHALALDPLFPYIGAKWSYTPTVYGPLFTALSYVFAPLSIAASALTYKAIAALASLGTVALVWNAARLRGIDPVKATALVGLNPLIVIYGVGGGHNDLLMMLIVVAGIYLMLANRVRSASALTVTAAAIKLTGGLMLPFAIASGGARRARERRPDFLIGAGLAAAVIATLSFALFGLGPLHLFGTIQKVQSEGDWHSIPGFIGTKIGWQTVAHVVGWLLAGLFAAVFLWLLRRVWRGQLDWIDAAGWSAVTLLLTASSLLPWYVAWLIPLAALASDRRLWRVAIVMTGVIQLIQLIGYAPHIGAGAGS